MNKTIEAVTRQISAMGGAVFEIGLFKPQAIGSEPVMMPRTWDVETLLRSIGWLRRENRDGRNIYIRPKGEHDLSLVDDVTKETVTAMKQTGFAPALVVETSPGNYQAWLRHHEPLAKELSTAVARSLAQRFGGDRGAADWRHFGRIAGFTNRKAKRQDPQTGLFPFVRLTESAGQVYPEAHCFIAEVRQEVERQNRERQEMRERAETQRFRRPRHLKSIDDFRQDPKYGGDGTRVDLAYAIYALSNGASDVEVSAVLRSRDLSHKGDEKRRLDYLNRTIRKALNTVEFAGRSRH